MSPVRSAPAATDRLAPKRSANSSAPYCCAGTIERSFGNPEPQSPIDKKAPAHRGYNGGGMPAYAPTAKEREIVREGCRFWFCRTSTFAN